MVTMPAVLAGKNGSGKATITGGGHRVSAPEGAASAAPSGLLCGASSRKSRNLEPCTQKPSSVMPPLTAQCPPAAMASPVPF